MSVSNCIWYIIAVAYSPDNTGRRKHTGGREQFEMQIYPLASNLQLYRAVDLSNMFLQFLRDKEEKRKHINTDYAFCCWKLIFLINAETKMCQPNVSSKASNSLHIYYILSLLYYCQSSQLLIMQRSLMCRLWWQVNYGYQVTESISE